jgi:pimeloyl-ACP methyl ester carboxylesterase
VIGVGAQSAAILPGRAAVAVAERLGTPPVTFPGGHDGFLGEPDAFAATLRTVLAG